jgi:hypothetical protein
MGLLNGMAKRGGADKKDVVNGTEEENGQVASDWEGIVHEGRP